MHPKIILYNIYRSTHIIFGRSVVNVIGDNNPTFETFSVMVQKCQTRIQTELWHALSNVNFLGKLLCWPHRKLFFPSCRVKLIQCPEKNGPRSKLRFWAKDTFQRIDQAIEDNDFCWLAQRKSALLVKYMLK